MYVATCNIGVKLWIRDLNFLSCPALLSFLPRIPAGAFFHPMAGAKINTSEPHPSRNWKPTGEWRRRKFNALADRVIGCPFVRRSTPLGYVNHQGDDDEVGLVGVTCFFFVFCVGWQKENSEFLFGRYGIGGSNGSSEWFVVLPDLQRRKLCQCTLETPKGSQQLKFHSLENNKRNIKIKDIVDLT